MVNLKQWLPSSLKENNFWTQLLEVLEEEFNIFRTNKIDPFYLFFRIRENMDIDDLIEVSESYGFSPDRSIEDSLSFLQFDVESIGHRKKYLTTYIGYEYIYKSLGFLGDVFILYSEGNKLIRAEDDANISHFANIEDYSLPFLYTAERNYAEFFSGTLAYDQNPTWFYDISGSSYDSAFFRQPTKHIAIEYFLQEYITVEGEDFLIPNIYLEYLLTGVNYNRRLIESPHCGTQLTLLMDNTGDYDSWSPSPVTYSIPNLKLKASVQPSIFSTIIDPEQIAKVVVGTGTQSLRSQDGTGSYPTSLVSPLYTSLLEPEEIYEDSDFWVIQTMVGINAELDKLLSDVPSSSFNGNIGRTAIQRNSVIFSYSISAVPYEAFDDGEGNIIGETVSSGTINYETGDVTINFSSSFDSELTSQYTYNSLYKNNNAGFELTKVTEVGLLDENDDLIAYATFPPIEYDDNKFHTSYQFYIKKTPF